MTADLAVTNTTDDVNGDTSSPAALIANPGPDGISLAEALDAANQTGGPHRVLFDPSLAGGTIIVDEGLPTITRDGLTINGDIDGDNTPDVTVYGANVDVHNALVVRASHTVISGLEITGFPKHTVSISTDADNEVFFTQDVTIKYCSLQSGWSAVSIAMWQQSNCTVENVTIRDSQFTSLGGGGVSISPGDGDSNQNVVRNVRIQGNTMTETGAGFAVAAIASTSSNNSSNLIHFLEIVGNTMTGHQNLAMLLSAGNDDGCEFNRIEDVLIEGNEITATPVAIELVGGVGSSSHDNSVSRVEITKNRFIGGGVQLACAYENSSSNNRIEDVRINRNHITSCAANGVMLTAGSVGASWNSILRTTIANNLVDGCVDAGILLHGDTGGSPDNLIDDVKIVANTIVNNGNSWAGGININSLHSSNQIKGVTIDGTILWGNSGGDAIRGSVAPGAVRYSIIGDGRYIGSNFNFYDNPDFSNPGLGNYRLTDVSPAVDSGNPSVVDVGPLDREGLLRIWDGEDNGSNIIDIGAHEYNSIPALIFSDDFESGNTSSWS